MKLLPKQDGSFQIHECINDNAYKLELQVLVNDLSLFDARDDLKANSFQED